MREDERLVGLDPVVVELVDGLDLSGREAHGGVGGGAAQQGLRREAAARGVLDDVVGDAVLRVALLEDFIDEKRDVAGVEAVGR